MEPLTHALPTDAEHPLRLYTNGRGSWSEWNDWSNGIECRALLVAQFAALFARAERAEAEVARLRAAVKVAADSLEFYASGRPNAFRCASESIDLDRGTGPCCERVIDAGGIAAQALASIAAAVKPAERGEEGVD